MSTKYTPGPWKACGGQIVQAYSPYDTIATTYDERKSTEDSPDAVLMAGAPGMAEALRSAVATLEQFVKLGRIPENVAGLRDARAALAKAGL